MYSRTLFRFVRRRRRQRRSKSTDERKKYLADKARARELVIARLNHFRLEYIRIDPSLETVLVWQRIAIRDQRSRWGSCSSKKNLNFNYRLLTLSPELRDYIIVHELCHLKELHHRAAFWDLMKLVIPEAEQFHIQARSMRIS
jgi:predicted metal-dependent hydrolase